MRSSGQQNNSSVRSGIIHADDFGKLEQITLGICADIQVGIVMSASIMANMPATDFAVERVRALLDSTSFGVHSTLCEIRPRARSLVDGAGNFCSKKQLCQRLPAGYRSSSFADSRRVNYWSA
jgi:predicted glycoside hydrolase/deacetylase ChbG (UPF0249 family)